MPYPNFTEEEIERWREEDISREFLPEDMALEQMRMQEKVRLDEEQEEERKRETAITQAKKEAERLASLSKEDKRIEKYLSALQTIFEARNDQGRLQLLQKLSLTRKPDITDISNPQLVNWHKFYQEVFNETPDFSQCPISANPGGYGWILPFAKGLTANRILEECKARFTCRSYCGDDLDKSIPTHERTTENGSYIIRVRDRVEADEELKNLSANQIKGMKLMTMTLPERLLLELWYFWKTGKHLDIQNITLCAGSRHTDGYVPRVDWYGAELVVNWNPPDGSFASLRARSAV